MQLPGHDTKRPNTAHGIARHFSALPLSLATLFAILFAAPLGASAQVRLPRLVSDGMVLQRDAKINIWGWAPPGEKVTVSFRGKTAHTTTSKDSTWRLTLPPMHAGGPFTMTINEVTLRDVLVGDVWFCSGQSNMVLDMERIKEKYPDEIPGAHYPEIRNFFVPTAADVSGPHEDLPGGQWRSATPPYLGDFGAATWFFAKRLYLKYHIPIGLINSSVGGTPVQAWISESALHSFPEYTSRLSQVRDTNYVGRVNRKALADTPRTQGPDLGLSGPLPWFDTAYMPQGWHHFWFPGYWADQGIRDLIGTVWFRKEIDVPPSMAGVPAHLYLGRIVDADQVYVNGVPSGHTTYQYPPRRYTLPAGLLHPGKNILVVRVTNYINEGGFVPDKPYFLEAGTTRLDLRGDWVYKVGQVFLPGPGAEAPIAFQYEPTGLYNAMVAPAINYVVKGFLWYQGETNTSHPGDYAALLKTLIGDWREKWGDLPFLYVQLANFKEASYSPSGSGWAALRDQQRQVLSVPGTAMAVTIDAGEWNDIHPLDKADVGERLALAAEHLAYGDSSVVYSGPLYSSARVDGDRVVLHFDHTGGGLVPKGDTALHYFSIAGPDNRYVWADAHIEGDNVVLRSPQVPEPAYVRYGWADNPEGANLYNREGLPASPFETGLLSSNPPGPWQGKQCAVVLTYDDAIDVDLDNVLPVLDSTGLKGTFYLIGSSPVVSKRMNEWKVAAERGNELGNHTLFHPCDGGLPGRSFVTPDRDLARYTVRRAVDEARVTNALLEAIDGRSKRTFAYPCGDMKIGDTLFYPLLRKDFTGARGVTPGLQTLDQVNLDDIHCYAINGQTADYMIGLVRQAMQTHTLLVFLFHGVGGGHNLNVSLEAHSQLLHYLQKEERDIWIAPMEEVAEYIEAKKPQASPPASAK